MATRRVDSPPSQSSFEQLRAVSPAALVSFASTLATLVAHDPRRLLPCCTVPRASPCSRSSPIYSSLVSSTLGLAAMLLASGEKGQRAALPYTTVMLHQPRGQRASGQASDIAIKAKEVLLNRKVALDLMSTHTGQSLDKLAADTNRCLYLDAQQAKDYGIVDKIVTKTLSGPSRLLSFCGSISASSIGDTECLLFVIYLGSISRSDSRRLLLSVSGSISARSRPPSAGSRFSDTRLFVSSPVSQCMRTVHARHMHTSVPTLCHTES